MTDQQLESVARWTPVFILGYFTAQLLIRVGFSANLEIDESQFVGQTQLALGYGDSHPPLYNWLIAGALALTGGYWPAAVALVKNLLLAGTYLLAFDAARRVTGRALTGLIVAASFMLLPQIVWKSQITLAHSILVMFAVVASLHAVICIARRGDVPSFLWLGLASAIGALAKYNFLLGFAAILIAAFSVPALRARLFVPKLAYAGALFAALFTPHFVWALQHLQVSTQRMAKLERANSDFGVIDIPWIGLDGFVALALAVAAWAGPLLLAWFAIRYASRGEDHTTGSPHRDDVEAFAQLFGRATAIGLGAFAAILLIADLHSVHERYVTPLLMPLPFWLALAWPLEGRSYAALRFLRLGAVVALLMVTAWPLWIAFGREHFAYPYRSFAAALNAQTSAPLAILAHQRKFAANIAIKLDHASIWEAGMRPEQVVVLWDAKAGDAPQALVAELGDGFDPHGEIIQMSFPYDNFSGQQARLNAQFYARKP
jgi:4-amino-4-deoxy-L-arabinose transferase-like glycosyltransferase